MLQGRGTRRGESKTNLLSVMRMLKNAVDDGGRIESPYVIPISYEQLAGECSKGEK